jgi:hypothetical protein
MCSLFLLFNNSVGLCNCEDLIKQLEKLRVKGFNIYGYNILASGYVIYEETA